MLIRFPLYSSDIGHTTLIALLLERRCDDQRARTAHQSKCRRCARVCAITRCMLIQMSSVCDEVRVQLPQLLRQIIHRRPRALLLVRISQDSLIFMYPDVQYMHAARRARPASFHTVAHVNEDSVAFLRYMMDGMLLLVLHAVLL